MLNKHCRDFLSFLSDQEPNLENGIFTFDWLKNHYHESCDNIKRMVRYLEAEGYVKSAYVSNEPSSCIGMTLEEKGKYYKQFRCEKFKESLLNSIFLPVIVTLLTYIATQLISKI